MICILPINTRCQIGIISINKTSNEFLAELEHHDWYRQEIGQMGEVRKREWFATRVLLKALLGEEKKIIYTNSGKPYFVTEQFYMSVSHTKGYATIIVNKEKPVSIDIECISPRVEKIRDRFMNKIEENNLSQKNPLIHLLLHWSAKETLYKFLDQKEITFKTQLHINPFEPVIDKWANFTAYETLTEKHQSFTIQYNVTKDYVLNFVY